METNEKEESKESNILIRKVISPKFSSHVYLVTYNKEKEKPIHVLFDCSAVGLDVEIVKSIESFEVDPKDISLIILSHAHVDHVACLTNVKEKLVNAKVLIHTEEAEYLKEGYCVYPKGTGFIGKVVSGLCGSRLFEGTLKFDPYEADIVMEGEKYGLEEFGFPEDEDDDDYCYVLLTPGHTKGSICLVCGENAFVGDTMFNLSIYNVYPPFANNEKELLESYKKLLEETNVNFFHPGHGSVLGRKEVEKVYEKKTK